MIYYFSKNQQYALLFCYLLSFSMQINFGSGARLKIIGHVSSPRHTHEKDGHLQVELQAPSDDTDFTEGICGTFDGNPDNDFLGRDGQQYDSHHTSQFARTWLYVYHGCHRKRRLKK